MSYKLIRAHWKIGTGSLESATEKISLHLDETDFAAFSRQIIMAGLQKNPVIKYRTEGGFRNFSRKWQSIP